MSLSGMIDKNKVYNPFDYQGISYKDFDGKSEVARLKYFLEYNNINPLNNTDIFNTIYPIKVSVEANEQSIVNGNKFKKYYTIMLCIYDKSKVFRNGVAKNHMTLDHWCSLYLKRFCRYNKCKVACAEPYDITKPIFTDNFNPFLAYSDVVYGHSSLDKRIAKAGYKYDYCIRYFSDIKTVQDLEKHRNDQVIQDVIGDVNVKLIIDKYKGNAFNFFNFNLPSIIINCVNSKDFYADRATQFFMMGNRVNHLDDWFMFEDERENPVSCFTSMKTGNRPSYDRCFYNYMFAMERFKIEDNFIFFRENIPYTSYSKSNPFDNEVRYKTVLNAVDLDNFRYFGRIKEYKRIDKQAPYIPIEWLPRDK